MIEATPVLKWECPGCGDDNHTELDRVTPKVMNYFGSEVAHVPTTGPRVCLPRVLECGYCGLATTSFHVTEIVNH